MNNHVFVRARGGHFRRARASLGRAKPDIVSSLGRFKGDTRAGWILVASAYPRSACVYGRSCGLLGGAIFDLKVNINIRNDRLKS